MKVLYEIIMLVLFMRKHCDQLQVNRHNGMYISNVIIGKLYLEPACGYKNANIKSSLNYLTYLWTHYSQIVQSMQM